MNDLFHQQYQHRLEFHKLTSTFRVVTYAMLHARGINAVFNFLRYNVACLVRMKEVEALLNQIDENGLEIVNSEIQLTIARFGRVKFYEQALLSDMRLDLLASHEGPPTQKYAYHKCTPKKLSSDITVVGGLRSLLLTMCANQAYPTNESDAHNIENLLFREGDIKVRLSRYVSTESPWDLTHLSEESQHGCAEAPYYG